MIADRVAEACRPMSPEEMRDELVRRAAAYDGLVAEIKRLKRIEDAATALLKTVRDTDWGQSFNITHACVTLDAALRAPREPDEPSPTTGAQK